MRRSLPFIVAFFALYSHTAQGADWASYRGGAAMGVSPDKAPTQWDGETNLVWKTELPGAGASSPVVFQGRVYLTAFSGYGLNVDEPGDKSNLKLHVLCYDRNNGQLLWDRSIAASPYEQEMSRRVADHGYATNTVAVDETGVYAFFGVSGMVSYSLEGERRWQAPTGDKTAGFGSAASPVLYKNLVLVNCSIECGALIAYEKASGKVAYRIEDVERSWTTPTIAASSDGRDELILSYKMWVAGHDPNTGKQLWKCQGIQDYVVPCVVAHEGVAFVIGGRKNQSMAIRLGGNGDVTESHKLWETRVGANVTSPLYHEGKLYWASDKGIACCLNAANGEEIYRERIRETKSRIYASAVLAGGHIYITTRDAGILVVSPAEEYQVLGVNKLMGDDSLFNATPAISNGHLFTRTDRYLYCIGERQ